MTNPKKPNKGYRGPILPAIENLSRNDRARVEDLFAEGLRRALEKLQQSQNAEALFKPAAE